MDTEDQVYTALDQARQCLDVGQYIEALSICEQLAHDIAIASDAGQQMLAMMVEACRHTGDLGRARALSEAARRTISESPDDCSLETLLEAARQRAELAREFGQPDDAEEMFHEVLAILEEAMCEDEEEEEADAELSLGKAKLLEWRAHNRWMGFAVVLAEFDMEDATNIYSEVLGPDSKPAQEARDILMELKACA